MYVYIHIYDAGKRNRENRHDAVGDQIRAAGQRANKPCENLGGWPQATSPTGPVSLCVCVRSRKQCGPNLLLQAALQYLETFKVGFTVVL